MKRLIYGLAAATLIVSPNAQAHGDNHPDQRRGSQPCENERNTDRGQHRGWQKDRGHEWRRNVDRFLLIAVAAGMIAAVILTNGR